MFSFIFSALIISHPPFLPLFSISFPRVISLRFTPQKGWESHLWYTWESYLWYRWDSHPFLGIKCFSLLILKSLQFIWLYFTLIRFICIFAKSSLTWACYISMKMVSNMLHIKRRYWRFGFEHLKLPIFRMAIRCFINKILYAKGPFSSALPGSFYVVCTKFILV